MKSKGIKVILTDIDCTLIEYKGTAISRENMAKLQEAKKKGFRLYALSNTRNHRYKIVSMMLGIPVITGARKPLQNGFRRIVKELKCRKQEMVMAGDRITADIFGGNLFGIYTIYVKAIEKNAPLYYWLLLQFEKFMYWLFK